MLAAAAAGQSTHEASSSAVSGLVGRVSWRHISLTAVADDSDWLSGVGGLAWDGVDRGGGVGLSVDVSVRGHSVGSGSGTHGLLVQWHSVHDIVLWEHVIAVCWRVGCRWWGV